MLHEKELACLHVSEGNHSASCLLEEEEKWLSRPVPSAGCTPQKVLGAAIAGHVSLLICPDCHCEAAAWLEPFWPRSFADATVTSGSALM